MFRYELKIELGAFTEKQILCKTFEAFILCHALAHNYKRSDQRKNTTNSSKF